MKKEDRVGYVNPIIELRFRNYGEITVDDNGRYEEWKSLA